MQKYCLKVQYAKYKMMKNKLGIILLLLMVGSSSVMAITKAQQGVINQANKMAKAYLSKHYITYAQFAYSAHPSAVADTQLAEEVEKHMADLHAQKNDILAMSFSEPTAIVKAGKLLQCAVPVKILTHISGGNLTRYTNMIAVSADNGKHWRFMDTGGKSIETIVRQFPEISSKIVLPALPNETYEPDQH